MLRVPLARKSAFAHVQNPCRRDGDILHCSGPLQKARAAVPVPEAERKSRCQVSSCPPPRKAGRAPFIALLPPPRALPLLPCPALAREDLAGKALSGIWRDPISLGLTWESYKLVCASVGTAFSGLRAKSSPLALPRLLPLSSCSLRRCHPRPPAARNSQPGVGKRFSSCW